MIKKITFTVALVYINNIKCSEEKSNEDKEIDKIKEKINEKIKEIYNYGEDPLELYKKTQNRKNYDVSKAGENIKAVNNTNNISEMLKIKIVKNNSYFHFLKSSLLLKKYLLDLTKNLNNLNEESMNILERFIKLKYVNSNDGNINFDEIKEKVEEIYFYFVQIGLKKIKGKFDETDFKEFTEKEFDYIKDDYFDDKEELNKKYNFLENYKKELYKLFKSTKGTCASKFISTDDLESTKYFPKHWEKTINSFKEALGNPKINMYDYNFCNEGIKNKENKCINTVNDFYNEFKNLSKNKKYKELKNYLELLEDFNKSIDDLKIGENTKFLNDLEKKIDEIININEENITLNTIINKINKPDKEKIKEIGSNIETLSSKSENIKKIFNHFENDKFKDFNKKYKDIIGKNKELKSKLKEIIKIRDEINALINEIKAQIFTLNKNDEDLNEKYRVNFKTIKDEDYKKKTKKELNDIKSKLKVVEKDQEENIEKQKKEKDQALLGTAKDANEKKKIQNSINLRDKISKEIKSICEKFEKEYNPTENDSKTKIEENLILKLNKNKQIKNYLEDEFNKEKGLSKNLENILNSEKAKIINKCELKLNTFLKKKKEEEEEKEKEKEKEKKDTIETKDNIDTKGDIQTGRRGCRCSNKNNNDNENGKGKKKCC